MVNPRISIDSKEVHVGCLPTKRTPAFHDNLFTCSTSGTSKVRHLLQSVRKLQVIFGRVDGIVT